MIPPDNYPPATDLDAVTCPACHGDGVIRGSSRDCPACSGTGTVHPDHAFDLKDE